MDHDNKTKYVNVALSIFSGMSNIHFDVSSDGESVTIHFDWPTTLFKANELFEIEICNGMNINHPKIHCLKSHLMDNKFSEKVAPQGSMNIKLPLKVF